VISTGQRYVAVVGAGQATEREFRLAQAVGEKIAALGHVLVCGGLAGVMEGAAAGASQAGGLSIGILPGADRRDANPYLTVTIPTGFSHGRNYLVVSAADGVIAIGGGAGTLSEIGLALKLRRPVVLLESLDPPAAGLRDPLLRQAKTVDEALSLLNSHWGQT
jgi:uncharacterized protein (TIGR00725 family)